MVEGPPSTLTQRLDEKIAAGLSEERALLNELRDMLIKQEFGEQIVSQTTSLKDHLEELFLLVIVGEVKAGKSSFINALLNADVCKVGAIPTTDKIHILKHGDVERERIFEEYLVEKQLPFDALRNINIVDTPGTNSIVKRHGEITESFIPRCDLVLFTTSVDRPFSETEREFLQIIVSQWSKKILFILTKKDIKEPQELEDIRKYVMESMKKFFDLEPMLFIVSAKEARKAKQSGDNALYESSGFKALEDYLFKTLSEGEKLKLKLESPIDSSVAICDSVIAEFDRRVEELRDDRKVLENIRSQLEQSETDLKENYGRFILEIDNVLYEMERRGRNWIDDTVKITNIGVLRSNERFRGRFKEEVVKDYEIKIDEVLNKAVDWFMKKYLKVWQDTTEYFADQAAKRPHEGMVGKVAGKFEYNRERIYDMVRANAKDQVKNFDYDQQVRSFMGRAALGINSAFAGTFLGVGGAALVIALTTAAGFTVVDVTGILGGLTLLTGSLFVLPMQRRRIRSDFSDKVLELKSGLTKVLQEQIQKEAREAIEKIRESFGPFFDYVKRTSGAVEESRTKVKTIREGFLSLKRRFGKTLEEEKDTLKSRDTEARKAESLASQPTSAPVPPTTEPPVPG
jgi:ribosome biogenesis GTPase A